MAAEPAAMFRGGPAHLGVYGEPVASPGGVDFTLKWRFKTGAKVRSTPLVVDGTVYCGSEDGHLYAVAADTGTLRWKAPIGGDVSSSPAAKGNLVYIVSGDGALCALDRTSGRERWRTKTGAPLKFEYLPDEPRIFDYYGPSPTVSGDRVYFGSSDGSVYAVDAADGRVIWKFATGQWVHATPAVVDGTVYVGNYDGQFFALDEKTGSVRWKYQVARDKQFPMPVALIASPAVADGTVVFASNAPTGVVALDTRSGELRWRVDHPGSIINSSPSIANGVVYVGSSDAQIVQAIDLKTGTEKWHCDTRARVFTSPMVADGLVYFGNTEAYFLAIGANDGKPRGMTWAEAGIHSSPVMDHGVIYFGSDDDFLYAIGRTIK
jgi:outer membrane protein assembly factor BamB